MDLGLELEPASLELRPHPGVTDGHLLFLPAQQVNLLSCSSRSSVSPLPHTLPLLSVYTSLARLTKPLSLEG